MKNSIPFLIGTWFICSTNFPMWTSGKKTNPTFNYSIIKGNSLELVDEVKYLKQGESKTIKGFDTRDINDQRAFTWRGKGLLRPLKSHWRVMLADSAQGWAVIYFTKTVFTPEGVDIISRTQDLEPEKINGIKNLMLKDSLLKKQVSSLKNLPIKKTGP